MVQQHKVALVLGSGGVKGISHVGILQRLREEAIHVDAIVGCSVGSLIAGFYAGVGLDPHEILQLGKGLNWSNLFHHSLSLRRFGALSRYAARKGKYVADTLDQLAQGSFDKLRHDIRQLGIVAYDKLSGREIFFCTGLPNTGFTLRDAVGVSCRVPLFYPARKRREDDHLLVDGGVIHPVPIDRAFGAPINATRVIAVDVRPPHRKKNWSWHLITRALYPYTSTQAIDVEEAVARRPDDVVLIRPIDRHYSMWGLTMRRVDELMRRGYEAFAPNDLARIRAWTAQPA
ncbi:MAG: patatin-like phospholipase family protein [Verrucomicrobia bacterium]|nr:patatin-like phospholipase family protein [Verrucomicrobiota bacterium]